MVYFALFQAEEADSGEAAACIKFAPSRLATQSELLGLELARHLGILTPKVLSYSFTFSILALTDYELILAKKVFMSGTLSLILGHDTRSLDRVWHAPLFTTHEIVHQLLELYDHFAYCNKSCTLQLLHLTGKLFGILR